jgi:hypothetical protein
VKRREDETPNHSTFRNRADRSAFNGSWRANAAL